MDAELLAEDPFGRHSRPRFRKSLTCPYLLVSTVSGRRKRRDLIVDVVERGTSVRMGRALPGFHAPLKRVHPLFRSRPTRVCGTATA